MAYKCKYWLSAGTAVIEGLFFSGIIFGWSSITCVLKTKGYFSYLCEDSDDSIVSLSNISQANSTSAPVSNSSTCSSCRAQDESINLVFTVASAVLSFSAFPNGYVFDRFGTWVSRLMAAILVTLGGILMSISTVSTSWLKLETFESFMHYCRLVYCIHIVGWGKMGHLWHIISKYPDCILNNKQWSLCCKCSIYIYNGNLVTDRRK